jgi:hypothetical protein
MIPWILLALLLAFPGRGWAGFAVSSATPPKVFTPNSDGCNDVFTVRYADAPGATVTGRIYDLQGRSVADMKAASVFASLSVAPSCTAPYTGADALGWDGLDSDGKKAPKGIYVYQLESQGKLLKGTVALAR